MRAPKITSQVAVRLSVVIPAFNEEATLAGAISEIDRFLHHVGIEFDILVVDDGSTDNTWNVIQQLENAYPQLQSLRLPRNLGKGAAVKAGVLASAGSVVLFTDADQS